MTMLLAAIGTMLFGLIGTIIAVVVLVDILWFHPHHGSSATRRRSTILLFASAQLLAIGVYLFLWVS